MSNSASVKGGATYPLSDRLALGLGAFGSAFILTSSLSPAGAPTSRWYGVNARAAYLLIDRSDTNKFYLSPGFYLWGMLQPRATANLSYGVQSLSGPQIVMSGRFKNETGREYGGYLKIALISDGFNFKARNNELAAGGSYQIGKIDSNWKWNVSADIARAAYRTPSENFELLSYSISLGVGF